MKLVQFLKIGQDGFVIEPVLFDMEGEEELPEDYIEPYSSNERFFIPKYNHELDKWVETLSPEEITAIDNLPEEIPPDPKALEDELRQLQMAVNMLMLGGMS